MSCAQSSRAQNAANHGGFLALVVLLAAIFHQSLWTVVHASLYVERYSQILLVIPISVLLIYQERQKIFARVTFHKAGGSAFLAVAVASAVLLRGVAWEESARLSLAILSFVSLCLSAFVFCYGTAAFHTARFALLFLVCMTPLPDGALHQAVTFLQEGSAYAACLLFQIAHIPYVRHGMVLELPKVVIYIAEECSGIRSSLILFLCSLVLGHLFLKSGLSKILLIVATLALTIAKNGFRIFALASLGMYVNPSFLTGRLHHQGGIVFFGLAFVALGLIIWLLQRLGNERPSPEVPIRPCTPVRNTSQ